MIQYLIFFSFSLVIGLSLLLAWGVTESGQRWLGIFILGIVLVFSGLALPLIDNGPL
jgi:hypothetical protein